jgi:hypothetical protein
VRIAGHRFMKDGSLEVELVIAGRMFRAKVNADETKSGSARLVPALLTAIEDARRKAEMEGFDA